MSTYTLTPGQVGAYGKALVANTADTVEITGSCEAVEVTNLTGTAAIYFTTDGTTPTVKGATTHEIPAAVAKRVTAVESATGETLQIKLISSGTPEYSVARSQVLA